MMQFYAVGHGAGVGRDLPLFRPDLGKIEMCTYREVVPENAKCNYFLTPSGTCA